MKKFKKSEIAIYAVALMLVAAGYFNYSTFENKTKETYSEDIVNNIDEKSANVGDAVLVSSNEIENNENNTNNSSESVVQEEKKENETEETSSNETNEEDYYANAKLERDKMYAEMISNYEKILNKMVQI